MNQPATRASDPPPSIVGWMRFRRLTARLAWLGLVLLVAAIVHLLRGGEPMRAQAVIAGVSAMFGLSLIGNAVALRMVRRIARTRRVR